MTKVRACAGAAAMVAMLLVGGVPTAGAQSDYVGRRPVTVTRDPGRPGDPGDPGDPGGTGTKVLGRTLSRAAPIPITGGDVAGLVVVGMGAIGTGTYLLRRGRRAPR